MNKVKGLNISTSYEFDAHNVNADEDGKPKAVNGITYVSGQKIRYMLLETIRREKKDNDFVSYGDSLVGDIVGDIASDLNGFMITKDSKKGKKGKKTDKAETELDESSEKEEDDTDTFKRCSPVSVSFAFAKNKSDYFRDLFVRFKTDNDTDVNEQNKQRINNKTYSLKDEFNFNYVLDVAYLTATNHYEYVNNKLVDSRIIKLASEDVRKYRAELFIKGTSYLTGLANQARNSVINTPKKVMIVFDTQRCVFSKFFDLNEEDRNKQIEYYNENNIKYFIGGEGYTESVNSAYKKAIKYLEDVELV